MKGSSSGVSANSARSRNTRRRRRSALAVPAVRPVRAPPPERGCMASTSGSSLSSLKIPFIAASLPAGKTEGRAQGEKLILKTPPPWRSLSGGSACRASRPFPAARKAPCQPVRNSLQAIGKEGRLKPGRADLAASGPAPAAGVPLRRLFPPFCPLAQIQAATAKTPRHPVFKAAVLPSWRKKEANPCERTKHRALPPDCIWRLSCCCSGSLPCRCRPLRPARQAGQGGGSALR